MRGAQLVVVTAVLWGAPGPLCGRKWAPAAAAPAWVSLSVLCGVCRGHGGRGCAKSLSASSVRPLTSEDCPSQSVAEG